MRGNFGMDKINILIVFIIFLLIGIMVGVFFISESIEDTITGKSILDLNESANNYIKGVVKNYSNKDNFYWEQMPVTYSFEINDSKICSENQKNRLRIAFENIKKETNGKVFFVEDFDGKIKIFCNDLRISDLNETGDYFSEAKTSYEFKGNKITSAEIIFYGSDILHNSEQECLDLEFHEILHCFGFEHNDNENSIMYFKKLDNCKNEIDKEIIDKLFRIYN